MHSSNGRPGWMLEICSTKDHFWRHGYQNEDKANLAAIGFLKAMRESSPDSVAALWENGSVLTIEGMASIKVPVFAIRAGEIGSVALRPIQYRNDYEDGEGYDESEAWKR